MLVVTDKRNQEKIVRTITTFEKTYVQEIKTGIIVRQYEHEPRKGRNLSGYNRY